MATTILTDGLTATRQSSPAPGAKGLKLKEASRLAQGRPFELINGRIMFKMPDYEHALTQSLLTAELVNFFKTNTIGRVLAELTHRLWPDNPHEARQPDLSVILNEHLEPGERYPTRAPDIAIEIISRDDVWSKLFDKATLYFEKGSREVWLVDPYQKGVLVVTPKSRRWECERLASPELLPGFRVELRNIFNWPVAESANK
jgi:Uma2 family endonuclease